MATGIPIPDEKIIPRKNLIYREAIICLFDKEKQEFIGNCVRIPALYTGDKEDEWEFEFNGKPECNKILIKIPFKL